MTRSTRLHHLRPGPRAVAAGLVALAFGLAACGDDAVPIAAPAAPAAAAAESAAATPAASTSPVAVSAADTSLGSILVGDDGLSVYGFTNDIDGASVCEGTCAEAWPPVIVGPDWDVAPGLDAGIFNTTTRADGSLQLVAGKWPLYYYGGDIAAGDLNGQGSGDVWFVVGTDGILVTDALDAPASGGVETAAGPVASIGVATGFGEVLVDAEGLSLYGFLPDELGEPTCVEACADAWPPLLVPSAELPEGLDPEVFSVVAHADGFQLKAGIWPLYRFAGDAVPGDANGQGSGENWFLANPEGGLVRPDVAEAAGTDSSSDY